uniref:CS domain-containing protein n=1 Tax=Panagrolaimus davidi TaxID=227884 RepID=A0A914Q9J6_9BILA
MNSVIQNPFEFPRQQDIGASELKIQQFKASEQLLNIHELQINNGQQGFPWLFLFEVFIFFKEFAYEIPNVIFAIYFTYFFSVPKENWCTILCVAFFIGTNLILVDEGRNQLQGQRDSDKGITYGLKIAILFLVIIAGNIGIEYYVSITGYQRKYKDFVNLLILFWTFLISFIYTAKALGQRAPIEMLSPNNGNGYNYDIYTWTQTDDEVELRVRMNVYRLDANDVICKFDSKRVLYCGLKSYYPVPVIYGTLMANIKPKFEKTILQDRKIVVITFKKADHALLCDRVFVHEKPIQFG